MLSAGRFLCLLVALHIDITRGQVFDTTNGQVRGSTINVLGKSIDVFHGIPFAKPPVGDLRFKHPQAADSWRPEVKGATEEKPSCTQSQTINNFTPADDPRRLPDATSEDCLYLSIWKPTSASNMAVMVWIYGGSFTYGGTSTPLYNGQYIAAENDVIVVSINYRLGPLGFGFLGPDTIPGNMGLMDQVEGMKWVRNNIANFGGDRNRITIFGESAGSYSVGYHLLSPFSKDLFNNAILQSGSPVNKVLMGLMSTKSEARENVRRLSELMQCSGSSDADIYQCLMAADSTTIITAFEQLGLTGATIYPVVDGYFLPTDPMKLIERGEHKSTNLLTGVTKDELTGFLGFYLNPADQVVYTTGEKFSEKDFDSALSLLTKLNDKGRIKALKTFYESGVSPPVNYLDILNHAGSDIFFKCPALQLSSLYTQSNNVYLYSLDYRVSTLQLPDWMGVPHSFDNDLVFGLPLNISRGYNSQDRELSRNMMTYWSNFAKSGNPNSPVSVTANWPVFDKENKTYMALDVGSNLATKHGFRRLQCAFVNDILPMIPKDGDTTTTPTLPPILCPSSGSALCLGCVQIVLGLLTVSVWMLKQ